MSSGSNSSPSVEDPSLRRSLNLWETSFGGVGMILGAGIYALVGVAATEAASGVWLSFLIAAAVAALIGLCYAELASMFPAAGADFEYAYRALGPRPAFLVGWSMTAGNILAAAAVSVAFASYLGEFVSVDRAAAAVAALLVATVVASIGIKESMRVAMLATIVEVCGLVFIIAIGLPSLPNVELARFDHGLIGVLSGASLVMFAFNGFAQIATLAEEARDAEHVVPRAMLLAVGITSVLYVSVALSALAILGPVDLGLSATPLTAAASKVLGTNAGRIIALIALFSTANTMLLHLIVGSRMIYGMALRGALPTRLAWIQPRVQTPILAIAVAAAVGTLFALSGELSFIAGATDFAIFVGFGSVCVSLIKGGKRCQAPVLSEGDFCFWHDPQHARDAAEARRLGGLRRRRENTVLSAYELAGLDNVKGLERYQRSVSWISSAWRTPCHAAERSLRV